MFGGKSVRKKSNEQLIQDQLDRAITVDQLIKHLETLPSDVYVGVVGHFGEAYLMGKYNFSYVREAYITPSGYWRDGKEHNVQLLNIYVPDIGPNPD